MKVLLVGFAKLKYMPYINFYLDNFAKINAEIHVLYWNRDEDKDISLPDGIIRHEFTLPQQDEVPKWSKIKSFLLFRKFFKETIKSDTFDCLVILSTLPAVILSDILCHNWKNKFIFDYRDYTYEWFYVYKRIVQRVVLCSKNTFVSSDAFREALPKTDKILTTHNLQMQDLNYRNVRISLPREHAPLRLSFWGFIRHEEINKKIIQAMGNDPRFEVHYYGREQQTALNLKAFVAENNFQNVFFHGAYQPEERYTFAAQTDLLLNMYENDNATKRAMGNKFYDGIIFYLPQICTEGSYMGQRVKQKQLGIATTPEDKLGDTIWGYYHSIKWQNYKQACDEELADILNEYQKGEEKIKRI